MFIFSKRKIDASLILSRFYRAIDPYLTCASGALGFALSMAYILLALSGPNVRIALTHEDGFIESLGAVSWAFAFLTMLYAYVHSSGTSNRFFNCATKRNVWFCLIAIFCFACFGEEISWGQRIFDLKTPALWSGLNLQKETNIHNLRLFNNPYLDLPRLVTVICITYGFIIPILVKSSKRCNSLSGWLGLPVPSLAIGSLFLLNYLSYRFVIYVFHVDYEDNTLKELHESNQAVVFFILALYLNFYRRRIQLINATPSKSSILREAISQNTSHGVL
jgi:hypothetical protein